jgi:SWI/SNF-related matrix-associated actin-dependent regulator 1 of chromatin subfamily A
MEQGVEFIHDIPENLFHHVDEASERKIPDLSSIEPFVPFWNRLRPYQKTTVQRFISQSGSLFLFDDMGLGKTIQAMAIMAWMQKSGNGKRTLLIVPPTLLGTWKYEIQDWLHYEPEDIFVASKTDEFNPETKLIKRKFYREKPYKVILISYPLLWRVLGKGYSFAYDMMICDECQAVKNIEAKQTRAMISIAKDAKYRLLLTGTACSYPWEMWTLFKALVPDLYPIFFDRCESDDDNQVSVFVHRYGCPRSQKVRGRYGRQHVTWKLGGARRMEELNAICRTVMLRRTKNMVLKDLPSKTRCKHILNPLSPSEAKQIAESLKQEKEDEDGAVSEASTFKFTKSCNLTNQLKLPQTLKFLEEYIIKDVMQADPTLCVLIVVHSTVTREAVSDLLTSMGIEHFQIHGKMKHSEKAERVREFQGGMYRVGILSIMAANAGITLTRASLMVIAELRYSHVPHLQIEDRICRIGQTRPCLIMYVMLPGSSDQVCWALIQKKLNISSQVIDGHKKFMNCPTMDSLDDNLFGSPVVAFKRKKAYTPLDF